VAPHLPSLAGLIIYSSRGGVHLPPSGGAFHRTATVTSFPCSKVAGRGPPLLPSLPGLFICSSREGVPLPSLWSSGCPTLFVMCLVFQLLVYYSVFFLFSLGRGQSVQGAMLLCPREYRVPLICSPCGLPSSVGTGIWQEKPSWFLRLMWRGDAMHRLGVWRYQSFASSWWFFLPGVSPASLQEFTLGSTLSASSL
jgi:hypothetical protein